MSNWRALLTRARHWLTPDGRLFLHVFTHRSRPYSFEVADEADWIAQHFFTGGIMPSHGLIRQFPDLSRSRPSGAGAATTTAAPRSTGSPTTTATPRRSPRSCAGLRRRLALWRRRWRLFFLATAGLFGQRTARLGRQPLPPAARLRPRGSFCARRGVGSSPTPRNPDPRVASCNTIALLVASNQPFYRVYVYFDVSGHVAPTLLTFLSTPFFLAVPAVSRRWPALGRAVLPLTGLANVVVSAKAFGLASGVAIFIVPCALIAAAFFRPSEKVFAFALLAWRWPSFLEWTARVRPGPRLFRRPNMLPLFG